MSPKEFNKNNGFVEGRAKEFRFGFYPLLPPPFGGVASSLRENPLGGGKIPKGTSVSSLNSNKQSSGLAGASTTGTKGKQEVVSITYEEIGLFPRSFSRVLDRFLKQVFSDVENLVIQEYRFYRYLFLTTLKCVLILFLVPFCVNFLAKNYMVRPLTEYFWNTKQTEIFLNSYQQKRAFAELKEFEEKTYFESLIFGRREPKDKSVWPSYGLYTSLDSTEALPFVRLGKEGGGKEGSSEKEVATTITLATNPLILDDADSSYVPFINPSLPSSLLTNPAVGNGWETPLPTIFTQGGESVGSGLKEWGTSFSNPLLTPPERGGTRPPPFSFGEGGKNRREKEGSPYHPPKEEGKELVASARAPLGVSFPTVGYRREALPSLERQTEFLMNSYNMKSSLFVYQTQEADKNIQQRYQEKTIELAQTYNNQSIEAITNFFADLMSLGTLFYLLYALEIQINITKSFLLEVFFGLDDSKKSLLILLITDLLVGYHSSNLWELFFEFLFHHYGLPESQTGIFLLVATLPVLLDVLFKYLIFRHLNRSSPATVATYHAMIE